MRLRLTAAAGLDLEDILVQGALDFGMMQAEQYVEGLQGTIELLGRHPLLGREHTEVSPPVRLHRHASHHILYLARDDEVVILRVLHGSANWIDHLSSS